MSSPGASRPGLDFAGELNPEQHAAVTHGDGPQLVLAGAGSGKTRVITYRVAWLIHERGVPPASIVAVTFTNKAAAEMRERIERLVGLHPLPTFVGTFHRFALGLLRRYGERVGLKRDFVIFDTDDQRRLMKEALKAEELAESSFPPRAMLAAISSAKNRLLDEKELSARAKGFYDERVARVYRRYQGMLRQASGVDFDDMLALAVKLLAGDRELGERMRDKVDHLLVDEFQDTNHAQLCLVLEMVGREGSITAVGDEDQGIYRWRGADLDNVLGFERVFPGAEVRKLEQNYRSTQRILSAAGGLVEKNVGRRGKRLWTDRGEGEAIPVYRARDEHDEARWLVDTFDDLHAEHGWREMAILVRTNAQTRAIEDELLKRQVPYVLVGGVRFYERAEIKDVIAYLRVLRNPREDFSLLRILNQPPRGIGDVTREMLFQTADDEGLTLWDVLLHDDLGGFPARSASALAAFRDLIVELVERAEELPLPELLEEMLERTGYPKLYDPDDPDGEARLENLRELLSAARDFAEGPGAEDPSAGAEDPLTAFLDHVALVTDLDNWERGGGVSLMTLHSAKGLEFPIVAVSGLEEGLLPHFNAGEGREEIEEERRLLYVGMTRAMQRLFLSTCRRRRIAGRYQDQDESRFLAEIPDEHLEVVRSPELHGGDRLSGVYSFFGDRGRGGGGGGRPGRGPGGRPSGRSGHGGRPQRPPRTRRPPRPAAATEPGEIGKGMRVQHPTLGKGVVLDAEGTGEGRKIVVFFDRAGKRKLIARYANLEPA